MSIKILMFLVFENDWAIPLVQTMTDTAKMYSLNLHTSTVSSLDIITQL